MRSWFRPGNKCTPLCRGDICSNLVMNYAHIWGMTISGQEAITIGCRVRIWLISSRNSKQAV